MAVEGRVQGRKLEREDLDAIERVIANARRQRRGGKEQPKGTRSAPDLKAKVAAAPLPLARCGSSGSLGSQRRVEALPTNPKKVRRPPPYATAILADDASDRSRVEVRPKHPVPLPPKLKPMDHWVPASRSPKPWARQADFI
ncbi:unnamed protein product [Effrenium voratum]|nr:unnamed protein product [Effrenium voratum]